MSVNINAMYKCLFCYGSTNCFQQNQTHLTLEQITTSCNNHLTREFVGDINWKNVNSVSGTFCQECYIIVEKLVSLTDHLNRILNDIKELDTHLVNRVSRERKNNEQSTSTTYNADVRVNGSNNFDIFAPKITTQANINDSSHWNLETTVSENNPLIQSERNFTEDNIADAFQAEISGSHNYDANPSPETGDHEDESETLSKDVENNQGKRKSAKKKTKSNLKQGSTAQKPKVVVTASDLLRHEKSGAPGYECDKCQKRFSRFSFLNRHDCSSPTIECEVCKISFSGSGALKVHMRCHTGEKPFKCETCGKCFSIKPHLTIHMRIHTGERPFKCEICKKTFREQTNYSKHLVTHNKNKEKMYKCDLCFKSFNTKGELNNHLLRHKKDRPYKCVACGKAYVSKGKLRSHQISVNYHSGENPFKCEHCEKAFPNQPALNSHVIHVHVNTEKVLCEECGKSFASNEYLALHILTHTEKGPFICETCGKKYPSSVRLKEHIKIYHSESTIKCETCGQIFQSQPLLLKHKKALDCVGPPFKCIECDESFGNKLARERHIALEHVSENVRRTYPCKQCQEIFHVSLDLRHHRKKMHALCVPCEICKRQFKNEQNLKRHQQQRNKQCRECPQQLSSKCEYAVHRQEHLKRKKGRFCKPCNLSFVDPKIFQAHVKQFHPMESIDNAESSQSSYSRAGLSRKCKLKSAESVLCSGGENNESDGSNCSAEEMYQDSDDEEWEIKEEVEELEMADSEIKTEYDYEEGMEI